jgi:hypothetical protein
MAMPPKRKFQRVEEFHVYFINHCPIIIDATEQRTQRPGDTDCQKLMYSGKKSPHRMGGQRCRVMTGKVQDQGFENTVTFAAVCARQGGSWEIVNIQFTPAP